MADGTFSVVPRLFGKNGQLFTIFGKMYNSWYPLIFNVSQRKDKKSYDFIIETLLKIVCEEDFEIPEHVTLYLDYEQASSKSFIENLKLSKTIYIFNVAKHF